MNQKMIVSETDYPHFEGTKFYYEALGKEMLLISKGAWKGWIAWKHPDGQWVTVRMATHDDISRINAAIIAAHHRT